MPLTPSQQQMAADLGNAVTQLQGAQTQIQKCVAGFSQSGATNMASDLRAAAEAIAPVLLNLIKDLNVLNDLSAAP